MHRSRPQSSRGHNHVCTNICGSARFPRWKTFFCEEFAVLKDGFELSHYIFGCSEPWSSLTKAERHQAMWLIENRHGIQWEDCMFHTAWLEVWLQRRWWYNDDWWWNCRVRQGIWEIEMAAGFTPEWNETESLWKYRGALRRHKISKYISWMLRISYVVRNM